MIIREKDFEELYRKYGPMVMRRCRFILKDEEKANDAFQETFLKLFERRTKLSNVCASLFFTTATRVCLNVIRSDKYRNGPQIDQLSATIIDNASMLQEEVTDVSLLLDCIFQKRDSKDREIAIYHFVDCYTLEETAQKMKMSVSGVRKRIATLKKHAEGYKNGN